MQKTNTDELTDILQEIGKVFQVGFEPLEVDDQKLEILQIHNMENHLNKLFATHAIQKPLIDLPLWAKVWPGAIILGRFLRKFSPQAKRMLELGSGMGILSLVAQNYGFKEILTTDSNPQAISFAKANILKNNFNNVIKARQLDIANDNLPQEQKFDLIAASELLYLDELHRPILKFLKRHLETHGKALFCTDRARLKPRFAKMASEEFLLEEGNIGLKAEDGERHIYNILILGKK